MSKGVDDDNGCSREPLALNEPGNEGSVAPAGTDPVRERVLQHVRALDLPAAWTVGGCERDLILGLDASKDIDIAVGGMTPEALLERLSREGPVEELTSGGRLVGCRLYADWCPKGGVEFALARHEVAGGSGDHHDFDITPIIPPPGMERDPTFLHGSILKDLERRDFTANAMARDVVTGELLDPFGGAQDVRDGVLRTVSPDSFRDDRLRILRGLAAWSRYGLRPDEHTATEMRRWTEHFHIRSDEHPDALSQERIFEEMAKVHAGPNRAEALRFARDIGLLQRIMPEMEPCVGFDQRNQHHGMTADEHILEVYGAAKIWRDELGEHEDWEHVNWQALDWAALYHDTGKQERYAIASLPGKDGATVKKPLADLTDDEHAQIINLHYHGHPALDDRGRTARDADGTPIMLVDAHETVGARNARAGIMRMGNRPELAAETAYLVEHHMYRDDDGYGDRPKSDRERIARQFAARHGRDRAKTLMMLRRCDRSGKYPGAIEKVRGDAELELFERTVIEQSRHIIDRNDLKDRLGIDGRTVMSFAAAGRKGGPWVGEVLDTVVQRLVDDPSHAQDPSRVRDWVHVLVDPATKQAIKDRRRAERLARRAAGEDVKVR